MYIRLGFAIAVHCDPDILIIDEILAVGDMQFQVKCLKFMSDKLLKSGCSVVFVSHNRYTIQDLCQSAVYLDSVGKYFVFEATLNTKKKITLFPHYNFTFHFHCTHFPQIRSNDCCALQVILTLTE